MRSLLKSTVLALLSVMTLSGTAFAAEVVVTPSHTQGWTGTDVRTGGSMTYINDATSPLPSGALQLSTDSTNIAKYQYLRAESMPLSTVSELGYATKQVSGPIHAAASFQLVVDLNGAAEGGWTTLVYEPYQNGIVTQGAWQEWDVDAGQFWSSRTVDGYVLAGAGGTYFYTLADLQSRYANAQVLAYGVNVGTYNPNYVVETDKFTVNGTTYNFEAVEPPPVNKDACKNGNWMSFTNPSFKNQGACVSYVESNNR